MDCRIKRTKKGPNDYELTLKGATRGTVLAMKNALERHVGTGSSIAHDVLTFLVAAIHAADDPELVRSVLSAPELDAQCARQVKA